MSVENKIKIKIKIHKALIILFIIGIILIMFILKNKFLYIIKKGEINICF